jgi:hypothetical protein
VLLPDTVLPLPLQPNNCSSCNRCTLQVASTMLAPDIALPHQLQLDSCLSCNWCILGVTNTECLHLILYYLFRCNRTVVQVAIDVHSELQLLSASACIIPLQLQPDSGSSCNWYTLWVVNSKCSRLILYYLFSCNRIVVWVVIDLNSELQILSASAWYCIFYRMKLLSWNMNIEMFL